MHNSKIAKELEEAEKLAEEGDVNGAQSKMAEVRFLREAAAR